MSLPLRGLRRGRGYRACDAHLAQPVPCYTAIVAPDDQQPERRRAERVDINQEFHDAGTMFVGDLSERGVFLHCVRLLPIGSELLVRFTVVLEDPVVLKAYGRVVRHQDEPRGMGIEFTTLDTETKMKLDDVVARRRPLDSGPPVPVEFETR